VTRGLVLQLGSKTDRPPNKGHTMYRRCSWVGLVSAAAPVAMCTVGFRAVAMCTVYRQEYNYSSPGWGLRDAPFSKKGSSRWVSGLL
jgi:hypothetical protein